MSKEGDGRGRLLHPAELLHSIRGDHPVITPRQTSRLLLTDPEKLRPKEMTPLGKITAACPEMTAFADLVRGLATLLKPAEGTDVNLTEWITPPAPSIYSTCAALSNGLEIATGPPWMPASPSSGRLSRPRAKRSDGSSQAVFGKF